MPSFDPEKFFETEREWQWIKHTIFAEYIRPWAVIVGSTSSQIHIVDAFAGAGTFVGDDGVRVDGTPLLAAKQAIGYNAKHRSDGRRCDLVCVEKEHGNFLQLRQLLLPRFESCAQILEGDYESHVTSILGATGDRPLLLLLDPIGLKAIAGERISPLIRRSGKTDVFLTLHFGIVHRAAGFLNDDGSIKDSPVAKKNVENVDSFFLSDGWRTIMLAGREAQRDRIDVERRLLDCFFENVPGDRYRHCSAYPVRGSTHEAPRYWLAHLGDHWRAFWVMNDLVAKVDSILLDRTYEEPGALPGLGASMTAQNSDAEEKALEDRIRELVQTHPHGIAFGAVKAELAKQFFGRVREAAYSRCVRGLVEANEVRRDSQDGSRWRKLELEHRLWPGTSGGAT